MLIKDVKLYYVNVASAFKEGFYALVIRENKKDGIEMRNTTLALENMCFYLSATNSTSN